MRAKLDHFTGDAGDGVPPKRMGVSPKSTAAPRPPPQMTPGEMMLQQV